MHWTGIGPQEADPELSVDANAVLSLPITGQTLQTIAWRAAEILQPLGRIQKIQLALRHGQEPGRTALSRCLRCPAVEDILGPGIGKRLNQ